MAIMNIASVGICSIPPSIYSIAPIPTLKQVFDNITFSKLYVSSAPPLNLVQSHSACWNIVPVTPLKVPLNPNDLTQLMVKNLERSVLFIRAA